MRSDLLALAVLAALAAGAAHADSPPPASLSDDALAQLVGPQIASRGKLLTGVALDAPRARVARAITDKIAAFEKATGVEVTLGLDQATVDSILVLIPGDGPALLGRLEKRWGAGISDGGRSVWLDPATRTQLTLELDRAVLTWQRYLAIDDLIVGRGELIHPSAIIGMPAGELRRQIARLAPGAVSNVSDAYVLLWRLPALGTSPDRMEAIASLEKGRVRSLKLHAATVREADYEDLRKELTRRFGKSHVEPDTLEFWHAGSVDIAVDYCNGSMSVYVGGREGHR